MMGRGRSEVRSARAAICLALLFSGFAAWAEAAAAPAAPIADRIRQHLSTAQQPAPLAGRAADARLLSRFYRGRDYRPAWVGADDAGGRAHTLYRALDRAAEEGLNPRALGVGAIRARLGAAAPAGLAELDLLLSAGLLGYARGVRGGPTAGGRRRGREADRADVLARAARAPSLGLFLGELVPANAYYRGLRGALARYRGIAAEGGWPTVPGGRTLALGASGPRVALLGRRLATTGDLAVIGAAPARFDAELAEAVAAFQRRHGLDPDGIVGAATRRALNRPVQDRIRQILVNMARWRPVPEGLGRRHILVNVAGFELKVMSDGQPVVEMGVVVGRPYRQTPNFSSTMTRVVFNPYWNVPRSIAVADILPRIRRDAGHLAARGIRVLGRRGGRTFEIDPARVDWSRLGPDRFPYRLRQEPGPMNALGRVKFIFPNAHAIYLHDTPDRELFSQSVRAFSSGCIRLEKPLELAAYLLAGDPRWSVPAIEAALADGERRTARLSEPVPVHFTYSTAWVAGGGAVHFRKDIYGRDASLVRALFAGRAAAARPPDPAVRRRATATSS